MTELIARTRTMASNYANRTWEALRDLHAVDNFSKADFHFIDMDEDSYVVISVAFNGDGKVWYDAYYLNGMLAKICEYDESGEQTGEIYNSKDC